MFIFVVEVFLELDHVVCLVDHHDKVETKVPGEDSLWRRLQFVTGLEDGPTRPLGGAGAKPRLNLVTRLCVGLPPENSKYIDHDLSVDMFHKPVQGFLLILHHLLAGERQLVNVVLQHARPVLQLIHDVPGRGHRDIDNNRGV